MDASVKQRLIGAAVLVVLAVIFLPMVFDGGDETQSESIDLGIPAEPARDFETRVVPLDPPASAPVPAPDANGIVTVDANAPDRVDAMAGTADAPEPAASTTASPAPVASPAATPAATTANTASVPVPPAPTSASEATPVEPAVAGGRYAVSFGSYANAANARALASSLVKGGIAARAEDVEVNGKPGMRVRAGPYADRAQAEKVRLQARTVRADAPGTVVEIGEVPAAGAAIAAAPSSGAGAWAVQIGAYQDQADATSQREKLLRAGFSAYIDTVRTEKGTLHRVRVGPEAARAGAEAVRSSLKSKLGVDGLVVTHP